MKTTFRTIICLTALGLYPALSQPAPAPAPPSPPPSPAASPAESFSSRLQTIIQKAGEPSPAPVLTKFNLDFPGGTPKDLVQAIEKASGRPLNAIVSDELSDTKLPALKMNSVDVSQLFQALESATRKVEMYQTSRNSGWNTTQTGCGFRQGSKSPVSDDTIWCFYSERPMLPPPTTSEQCRFYPLAKYLDQGMTVDDITTAIETGWKMLGEPTKPKISFHKDTKLLIAVGDPSKLETIDAVLQALGSQMGSGGGYGPGQPRPVPPPVPGTRRN